jgi:ABC-2 type transport system permease protein
MLGKDVLIFFRDANQWSQLLMLGSIVAIYLVSIRKLPVDTPFLKGLVSFLNIGVVGFVMSSVALRFVYPTVSLEGRSWWALRTSPLALNTILAAKFVVGFVPLAAVGVTLVWVSNHFLGVDPFIVKLSTATTFVMALTLTGMGVGFGALFPLFHVENVARIQTSTGGLLYMVTAMAYVAMTLSLEAVLVRWHYLMNLARLRHWDPTIVVSVVVALVVLNALFALVPFWAGRTKLATVDI